MRKAIIAIVIVGMFGWAIYDYIDKSDDASSQVEGSHETYSDEQDNNTHEEDPVVGVQVGNQAPNFELETLDGEVVKLSDYRGQRVMLNFWATWCPPCRAEMPDMQRFYEDKDVVVLAVNLIDSRHNEAEKVQPFVDDFNLTFPILLDKGSVVSSIYQISPIPTSFLIDSTGKIHNVAYGALNYELMVQEFEKMK